MPSPFPGMNPYLERAGVWEMFPLQFLSAVQQDVNQRVRPKYRVKVETRVLVHEPEGDRRGIGEPDWSIGPTTSGEAPAPLAPAGAATLTPPAYIIEPGWFDVEKVRYLAVYDAQGGELVTVVEMLSPSNKYAGADREAYLAKRREVLRSAAHFVEIDLLRGGPRIPRGLLPPCDYCAVVSRVGDRPRSGVWHWKLADPCPLIPIPLREPDADVPLDLKARIDEVYDRGGYGDDIYRGPPEPRLSPDEAAWAAQFLPPTAG